MCGIAGFVDFNGKLSRSNLEIITDCLDHRGPDNSGLYYKSNNCNVLGLGHRRLSILDLTNNGHQPYEYDGLILVYNGEIYNYIEIRTQLKEAGYQFVSDTDTEVIIKAYHLWGISCLDKFIGMFAFAIMDNPKNKLLLIRDRCGVKPLYYSWNKKRLVFSSEIKSITKLNCFSKKLDKNSVSLYFQYGYIPAPFTIYNEVKKLNSGSYIEFNLDTKELVENRYWSAEKYYKYDKLQITFEEAKNELETLLRSSFKYRKVSDVPIGIFLSGGFDSTCVATLLQQESNSKLQTFTIGFKDKNHDEALFAKELARHIGTEHNELYCTENDALDIIADLPSIFDEPFGDASAIPTVLLSRFARKKVKVALSADGGDELFGGYETFNNASEFSRLKKIKFLSNIIKMVCPMKLEKYCCGYNVSGKIYKLLELLNSRSQLDAFNTYNKYFYQTEVRKLLNYENNTYNIFDTPLSGQDNPKQELLLNCYNNYLCDDILVKVDRSTMSASLEGREPFLDHRILEYVSRLPYNYKYKDGISKHILREIVYKYVPKELLERKKQGFSIPLSKWLRNDLKYEVLSTVKRLKINNELFNSNYIDNVINSFYKYNGNPYRIWLLFVFQLWYEKWIE